MRGPGQAKSIDPAPVGVDRLSRRERVYGHKARRAVRIREEGCKDVEMDVESLYISTPPV